MLQIINILHENDTGEISNSNYVQYWKTNDLVAAALT